MPPEAKRSRVFSVFYGDEVYLLERELRRARRWPNRNVVCLDGVDVTEVGIVEAMGDSSLDDGDGTMVVVDNAEQVKLSGCLAEYAAQRDVGDRSSVLVAICREAQLSKGWSSVAERGKAIPLLKLKPWETAKIKARVLAECESLGVGLDDAAFDVLFLLHAEQTANILNEIRKAVFLVDGSTVTKEAVLAVCGKRHDVAPWAVSEAAFAKEPKRALRALSLLVQDRGEEVLVPVVAALMRQLETLLVLRHLLDRRASPEAMGTALGIHPYRVQKDSPAVKKHSAVQLLSQMKKLCELEAMVKGAAIGKRTRVELVVLSLAA